MDLELMKTFSSSLILLLHRCIYVDLMRIGVHFGAGILRWRSVLREGGVGFTLLCFASPMYSTYFLRDASHWIALYCI